MGETPLVPLYERGRLDRERLSPFFGGWGETLPLKGGGAESFRSAAYEGGLGGK
jgi:hypothetical protein